MEDMNNRVRGREREKMKDYHKSYRRGALGGKVKLEPQAHKTKEVKMKCSIVNVEEGGSFMDQWKQNTLQTTCLYCIRRCLKVI